MGSDADKIKLLLNYVGTNIDDINKFIEVYNKNKDDIKEIDGYINKIISDSKDKLESVLKNIESETKQQKNSTVELLKNKEEEYKLFIDDLRSKSEAVNKNLILYMEALTNNVQRELLSVYFENERKSLKGDINLNVIFAAIILFMIVDNILGAVCGYVTGLENSRFIKIIVSIIIAQISYNICGMYNNRNSFQLNLKTFLVVIKQHTLEAFFTPYWCWLVSTFIGMLGLMSIAFNMYIILMQKVDSISTIKMLPYTPLCMIIIWFTWFCSKNFSYTKQLCDEYEYKYVLSKSYLNYREEAQKLVDTTKADILLVDLMHSIVKNIAKSPVQSVKNDSNMPISELFQSFRDSLPKSIDKELK